MEHNVEENPSPLSNQSEPQQQIIVSQIYKYP